MSKKLYTFVAVILLFSANIYGGGFQINEHGAKAMGMGGAFTGLANDASAVYWNAAGLTRLTGTHFLLGTALIGPSSTFRGVTPDTDLYHMQSQTFFPSHFFASHSVMDNLSVGLGFSTPFGLGTKWDEDWIGKYLAVETELRTFTLTPVVAFSILDNLSISGGFIYSFADVTITRKNSQAPFEGDAFVNLEGDEKSAFGYTAGLMYQPFDFLSIGASFHSEVDYEFEGTATTTGAQQLIDAGLLPNGDVTAELTTPMNIAVGIALFITDEFTLTADYQYVGWSSYDTLKVNFVDPNFTDLASPREYDDSFIARLGAGYKISDELELLGGIYYDKNPVDPDKLNPSLPDSDRLGFSLGVEGRITENFTVSASYLFIRSEEVTVTNSQEIYTAGDSRFNGTYNSFANLLSFSFQYSL
ncbi:MAG: outer membrane protein transport protein [Ignavibacteriaceae bacterium]